MLGGGLAVFFYENLRLESSPHISVATLPESPNLGHRPTVGGRVCERQAHLRCFTRLFTTCQSR